MQQKFRHGSDAKVFRSDGVTDTTYTLHIRVYVCVLASVWAVFCHIVKKSRIQVSCKIANEEYGYVMHITAWFIVNKSYAFRQMLLNRRSWSRWNLRNCVLKVRGIFFENTEHSFFTGATMVWRKKFRAIRFVYFRGVKIVCVRISLKIRYVIEKKVWSFQIFRRYVMALFLVSLKAKTALSERRPRLQNAIEFSQKWVKAQARISRCKSLHVGAIFF